MTPALYDRETYIQKNHMSFYLATVLLASAAETTEVAESFGLLKNFEYQLTGMIIVMVVLAGLALILHILAKILFLHSSARATVTSNTGHSFVETAVSPAPDADEIQAVIAAAVYSTLGRPVRIVSMCPAQTKTRQIWASEGRRSIFLSHKLK